MKLRRNQNPESQQQASLRLKLLLTRAGLLAEQLCRAFWPFWSLAALVLATLSAGMYDRVSLPVANFVAAAVAIAAIGLLAWGSRRFRWPRAVDARARLDQTLPGRPLSALSDQQASGASDPASRALWLAHLENMRARAASAKTPAPDLRLSDADPYAVRYTALLALLVAVIFGSVTQVASVSELLTGKGDQDGITGPSWEGWLEPPAYTGLPSLYLNDMVGGELLAPEGSIVSLRLYGVPGALSVIETVSGTQAEEAGGAATTDTATFDMAPEITLRQNGGLEITLAGQTGDAGPLRWDVTVISDTQPQIRLTELVEVDASGLMSQEFHAKDDYGVVSGTAEFALDLATLDRRFGLAAAPDPKPAPVFDLPIVISGDRGDFEETLIENLSRHPWAGLPVTLTLSATDARGQTGYSDPRNMPMPGRSFFDPLARAVIEMRRDILWARANALRVAQVIRAITHRPEDVFPSGSAYLMLRTVLHRLEAENATDAGLSLETQQELSTALWDIALLLEDGSLSDALERMRQAQERLSQAMRDGATDQEIQQLMDALREATEDYLRQLAQNPESTVDQPQSGNSQQLTQQDIDQMMDRIQELMEQGRMAEAQELLNQLQQMMENMRVTDGGEGDGQSPGEQAMENLGETLRGQQGLSDQAFRDLQEQYNPNARAGENQGNEGRDGGQGRGQQHNPQGGGQGGPSEGGQGQGQDRRGEGQSVGGDGQQNQGSSLGESLADRQRALRNELARQQGSLPGAGSDEGEAARRALEEAGRAMDRAEGDLRDGNLPGALENQADAMEALREGMRQLGDALAENEQNGQGEDGEAESQANARDPLGRNTGAGRGNPGTGENLLQGEDIYRRARELLNELRSRSSDQERPQKELEYLKRLLERF